MQPSKATGSWGRAQGKGIPPANTQWCVYRGPGRPWRYGGLIREAVAEVSGHYAGETMGHLFLLVKSDTNPLIAIRAGAIEAIGATKYILKPTPTIERREIINANTCPLPLYFIEALTNFSWFSLRCLASCSVMANIRSAAPGSTCSYPANSRDAGKGP